MSTSKVWSFLTRTRGRGRLEELVQRARHCAATGWFPSVPGTSCCRPELAAACGAGSLEELERAGVYG